MKSVNVLKRLPVVVVFTFTLSAQTAIADHHGDYNADDKGNNVKKAFPIKPGEEGQTKSDKSMRKLDTKQSGKKSGSSNSGSTKDVNSDSTTIGKGTGSSKSTKSGSGTGWSGSDH